MRKSQKRWGGVRAETAACLYYARNVILPGLLIESLSAHTNKQTDVMMMSSTVVLTTAAMPVGSVLHPLHGRGLHLPEYPPPEAHAMDSYPSAWLSCTSTLSTMSASGAKKGSNPARIAMVAWPAAPLSMVGQLPFTPQTPVVPIPLPEGGGILARDQQLRMVWGCQHPCLSSPPQHHSQHF